MEVTPFSLFTGRLGHHRYEWYEIQDNIACWQEFMKSKVISTKVSIRPIFCVDSDGYFLSNTSYFIPAGKNTQYIAALLNSSVFFSYAKRIFVEKKGGWYEVQPEGLEAFPIPPATPEQQAPIIALVDKILTVRRADPEADISALEHDPKPTASFTLSTASRPRRSSWWRARHEIVVWRDAFHGVWNPALQRPRSSMEGWLPRRPNLCDNAMVGMPNFVGERATRKNGNTRGETLCGPAYA
jgi:hypothetical protein